MKKWINILILVIALMCSGCGADNTTKTEENPSESLRVYEHQNDEGFEVVGIPVMYHAGFYAWYLYVNNDQGNIEELHVTVNGNVLRAYPSYSNYTNINMDKINIKVIPTYKETSIIKTDNDHYIIYLNYD